MLKWCVDEGFLLQSPAAGIVISLKDDIPKVKRRIMPGEMVSVINKASEKYRREIMFAAYTGLRAGEQAVLTWDDINFEHCYVQVNKARKWGGELGGPKTRHGCREVRLSKALIKMLREWKMQQPLEMRTNNLVFPTASGSVADTNNWRNRGLLPACAAAKFEGKQVAPMKWKDLRNFFASVLIFGKQVDGPELAALLGHGSIEFTYKVYARYYRDAKRDQETGDVLDQAFETGQYQATGEIM
jgi:integrase